jgi:hypothetical protein
MRTLPRHVPAKSGRNAMSLAQVRPIVAPNRANVIGTIIATPAHNPAQAAPPPPNLPLQGEVPFRGHGEIVPQEWRETSPSDGGGRRGWGHKHRLFHPIPWRGCERWVFRYRSASTS